MRVAHLAISWLGAGENLDFQKFSISSKKADSISSKRADRLSPLISPPISCNVPFPYSCWQCKLLIFLLILSCKTWWLGKMQFFALIMIKLLYELTRGSHGTGIFWHMRKLPFFNKLLQACKVILAFFSYSFRGLNNKGKYCTYNYTMCMCVLKS